MGHQSMKFSGSVSAMRGLLNVRFSPRPPPALAVEMEPVRCGQRGALSVS